MKTLADIITLGNAAADAGEPLAINWPQVRGALYMFGRAGGGLDQVPIDNFDGRFPADYNALHVDDQALIPSSQTYQIARTQIARLLAALGEICDPWEALRMMIRNSGRTDIEGPLAGLATPAKEAGLAPADIRTDWVWSLDAEKGLPTEEQLQRRTEREQQGRPNAKLEASVRQRLRRGVAVFNKLFDIDEIAVSGLLPPKPIGPPPVYYQGRRVCELPSTLACYQRSAGDASWGGLPQVWRAMCVADIFDLPEDPSADDLLAPSTWDRITQLPQSATGVTQTTWRQYFNRARRTLLPHATPTEPNRLPERFVTMIKSRADCWALQSLWRLMCERDMVDATPDDLLHVATWRELWCECPAGVKPKTWTQYQGRARMMMIRYAAHQTDPYRVVTRAWADLPKVAKAALDPIRKPAERALMRPLDLTSEWVSDQELEPAQKAQVTDTLREVFFFAALMCRPEPQPDPAKVAWEALRTAIRDQGISTIGLAKVSSPAIDDGKAPSDLTLDWAAAAATKMDQQQRVRFGLQLRKLDSLLNAPDLAPMLYAGPIGALPDLRKRGKIEPPEEIIHQTDVLTAAYRLRPSTRREARATVRKAWTEAAKTGANVKIDTLEDLLSAAVTLELDHSMRRKVVRLLEKLNSMREAA